MFRFTLLVVLSFLFIGGSKLQAQEFDYLKHGKVFNLCSFKKECTNCNTCSKQRYQVKIRNNMSKGIKSVSYVFYSEVFNKVITKEAKVVGDLISGKSVGNLFVCVQDGEHWAISKIIYDDDSAITFVVHERLNLFVQEPDECDCNEKAPM